MSTVLHSRLEGEEPQSATRAIATRPGRSRRKPPVSEQDKRGQWGRFSLISVLTLVVLVPVVSVVLLALTPSAASGKSGFTQVGCHTCAFRICR